MSHNPAKSTMTTPVAENWCYTHSNVLHFRYLWTIDNFSFYQEEMGVVLTSANFSPKANDKLKWCLRVYPNGFDEISQDYMSVYLILVASDKEPVRARFKLSILNANREETKSMASSGACWFVEGKDWGFRNFLSRDYLIIEANSLLPRDKLNIMCNISVVSDRVTFSGQSNAGLFRVPCSKLSNDLELLFLKKQFSDIIISVGGREIQAHKAILAARSPVFAAMLDDSTNEQQFNRVEITDMDPDVMLEMLRFIYTGKTSNIEKKMAHELLVAADKYALQRLQLKCEEVLCTNLSIENAAEMLCLADLHIADQLKTKVTQFIIRHARDVMDTSGWKSMIMSQPHLISQVVCALATPQISPNGSPFKRVKKS